MNTEKNTSPEKEIVKLARKGMLALIGQRAIRASHRRGLSVTVLENGVIYRVYPDGARTMVKRVPRTAHHYTTGKLFIK